MADRPKLIDYASALDRVLESAAPLGTEERPLAELLGRVLAEPVRSRHDMPIFNTSSVDGYAVTVEDLLRVETGGTINLEMVGQVRAGSDSAGMELNPGCTYHILTGAAAPNGVAAMVMQEDVKLSGTTVVIEGPLRSGQYLRFRGEEFHAGDEIAPGGAFVAPGIVAAIAACGQAQAEVYLRPKVGLLVTGDELIEPGLALSPGQIFEANSYGLAASLQAMMFDPPVIRRVADDASHTRAALEDLLGCCEVVLTSGGVSVGEFDTVKPALAEIGIETLVWGVAIKPGKPFYFGTFPERHGGPVVFGLPGNPVAAMVTFHVFVRHYLLKCMGLCGRPVTMRARLSAGLTKEPGRMEFVPCRLSGGVADPVIKRGSHMLGMLVETNALLLFPTELTELPAGAEVGVISLEGRVC